jgi:hypothetical protein
MGLSWENWDQGSLTETHAIKVLDMKLHRNLVTGSPVISCAQMDQAILVTAMQGCKHAHKWQLLN